MWVMAGDGEQWSTREHCKREILSGIIKDRFTISPKSLCLVIVCDSLLDITSPEGGDAALLFRHPYYGIEDSFVRPAINSRMPVIRLSEHISCYVICPREISGVADRADNARRVLFVTKRRMRTRNASG